MAWASPPTLCSTEEKILFTCSIGKKLVSVCSTKELSRASGYVQYRFGVLNQTPELVYPTELVHPTSKFSYGGTSGAKDSLENLHFSLSGTSYTIYRESAVFDTNGSGIIVKTRDGKSSRLNCKETNPLSDLYVLHDLGLRQLPLEALDSTESFGTWPAESPNIDLLQGVRTHNFELVTWALDHGADVNYHGENDVGVLGKLVDGRPEAFRLKRVVEFDEESDRLLSLLLARGALPTIATQNGNTAVSVLSNRAPIHTVLTLLDAGWPTDYQYRLLIGATLGDTVLVKDALSHGADPNKPIIGGRHIVPAISRASTFSDNGMEAKQKEALAILELLLKAGAKLDEGTPTSGGGDIVRVYAYDGGKENIKPVLDLLIQYSTPEARSNSLYWLRIGKAGTHPKRQANLDWLLKRLEQ